MTFGQDYKCKQYLFEIRFEKFLARERRIRLFIVYLTIKFFKCILKVQKTFKVDKNGYITF